MPADIWSTLKRARTLGERHPDAPASVKLVALHLATYANGKTGASIRPGNDRVVQETGLNERTVERAIAWLVAHGELRRDKEGHRGSAACFTYLDVGRQAPSAEPPDVETPTPVPTPTQVPSETPPPPQFPCRDGCGRMVRREGARCSDCTRKRSRPQPRPAWMADDWTDVAHRRGG